MKKAFTLIELLIVVAIIAILAAIAVPNFLEAQTRAKVARILSDQRTYATALETYMIDNSAYPLHFPFTNGTVNGAQYTFPTQNAPTMNANYALLDGADVDTGYWNLVPSFAFRNAVNANPYHPPISLTTPVSYLSNYVPDTFAPQKQATFAYVSGPAGFLLWSPGPDQADQLFLNENQSGTHKAAELIIRGGQSLPSQYLIAGPMAGGPSGAPGVGSPSFTYDPTNGTTSAGDNYRTK